MIKKEDGTCGISYGSFDQNVLRSLIARMVIMHELPLRFVEHIGFREMMAHANPVVKPMSRNTLKSEILKLYRIEKVKTLIYWEKIMVEWPLLRIYGQLVIRKRDIWS